MTIFKESKYQPIKLRGFKFIGFHKDYPNACYYYKPLERNNYELMECMLEGAKKPEIGAGTTVKVLDTFMSKYLETLIDGHPKKENQLVIETVNTVFSDFETDVRKGMVEKFSSKVPTEVEKSKLFKKFKEDGYEVLYCSNDEAEDRLFGIVNIVLVKEERLVAHHKKLNIDRSYTLFRPLRFSVSPAYLEGKSKTKYIEMELNEIRVDHDILVEN